MPVPLFCTVQVTVTLPPVRAVAGAVTDVTCRSAIGAECKVIGDRQRRRGVVARVGFVNLRAGRRRDDEEVVIAREVDRQRHQLGLRVRGAGLQEAVCANEPSKMALTSSVAPVSA